MSQPNSDIPVFIIRDPLGVEKAFHRNHLLPVGDRVEVVVGEEKAVNDWKPVPKPRGLRKQSGSKELLPVTEVVKEVNNTGVDKDFRYEESSDSDSDMEYIVIHSRDEDMTGHRGDSEVLDVDDDVVCCG